MKDWTNEIELYASMIPYTESNFFNAKKRKGNKKSMKAFGTDFSTKRHEHRH